MDPVFLAGTKSGNVGSVTLDSNNVDCVADADTDADADADADADDDDDDEDDDDDDDDDCCLCPGRNEACNGTTSDKNSDLGDLGRSTYLLSCYLPRSGSARLVTEAWA